MCRSAADRVRGKEPFEALGVGRGRADADIHVAATDELRLRCHADLVGAVIVADRGANRVRAVTVVVAGRGSVRPADAATRVNAVVPVIIVIRRGAIPAAVMRLERVVGPTDAGVSSADHDALPEEALGPDRGRFGVIDSRLDRGRGVRLLRQNDRKLGLGKTPHLRVALDPCNIGA